MLGKDDEIREAVRAPATHRWLRSPRDRRPPVLGDRHHRVADLPVDEADASRRLGYGEEDLAAVPEGANLGLGCGNPQAIAALHAGETVLDLGSGAGFDCFLAARQVGSTDRSIGANITPEIGCPEPARTLRRVDTITSSSG